jgi:uncharacterized damage-inducible protein DinB
MNAIGKEFISQCIDIIEKKNGPKIVKCLDQLTEEQVWMRPNKASNSIGNIILHLCGNIRQYVISALGQQADIRERDLEFSTEGGYNKIELMQKLSETLTGAIKIIREADEVKLLKMYSVQGFNYSGVGIVVHITEHFSHHTGQIIFWTKQLTGTGLGFYSSADLNKRNSV